jgi:opacity protein-like surface antigen
MTRTWLLALLAALVVGPAAAQIRVQPVRPPVIVAPIQPAQPDAIQKVMTIEEAQAQIDKLRAERRELNAKLTEALATIEQMTTRGGSLVRAYCEGPNVSRNTAGGSENCGRYTCGDSSGLCKTSCSASATDCASGYSCDGGQCLTLAEVQARNGG